MKIALHASCHPGKYLFLKDLRLFSCLDLTKWSKVDHSASPCGCAVRARGALRRPALEGVAELLYGFDRLLWGSGQSRFPEAVVASPC